MIEPNTGSYHRDTLVVVVQSILTAGGFAIGEPRNPETVLKWSSLIISALEATDNRYLEVLTRE